MADYILAIDQGTTSSRAILFDDAYAIKAVAQQEFTQHFPHSGWVEHDADEIWDGVVETCSDAMDQAGATAADIAAIGITNQRETVVVWDRMTGDPIHNALVWQDRRTADDCDRLRRDGYESAIVGKTGLVLDPYFSTTKLAWLLDHVDGARKRAEAGALAAGTMDSFLLWRLTGGAVHATDATNASRTQLYNIHDGCWDEALCSLFKVPMAILPDVRDCAADFGATHPDLLGGAIRIAGMAGDQQAAVIGQACFEPGMMKSTYGTGCFALLNTGADAVPSQNRMLTTIAYQLDGQVTYALEGAIFNAGTAVQWLRDGLGIIETADETGALAISAKDDQPVIMVPAFTGLGAPWWDSHARGAIFGINRDTGPAQLARAALEAVCYQTRDLLDAMQKDWSGRQGGTVLRVDGGMVANDWLLQFLADMLDAPVDRPTVLETTALGAAYLAGHQVDFYPAPKHFAEDWRRDARFTPAMDATVRSTKYAAWQDAVKRTLSGRQNGP